jgi:hypothetical protein
MDWGLFALEGRALIWFFAGTALVVACWAGWLWANIRGRRLEGWDEGERDSS